MSKKSQRACLSWTFIIMILVAECMYLVGKPSGPSKSAQATAPVLFLMSRIFTWIPGHDDWAKAMAERFANISTANHATHRTPIGTRVTGYLSVETNADFRLVDSLMIFLLFDALAEFDRDIIRERTQAGLTASRVRGRKDGRPRRSLGAKRWSRKNCTIISRDPEILIRILSIDPYHAHSKARIGAPEKSYMRLWATA